MPYAPAAKRRNAYRIITGSVLACALLICALAPAWAQECRVAFDLGSSGMRAAARGAGTNAAVARRDLDLLAPLWAGQGLGSQLESVASGLKELPQQTGWPASCEKLGAGFSAWRLAWSQDPAGLASMLAQLRQQTGVSVLVMPQTVEGQLAYRSAQRALGPALKTSHILDIGGGSLQIAGEQGSFGSDLGQKSWLKRMCQKLHGISSCRLQPLLPAALAQARDLAGVSFKELPAQVGPSISLTAISRPITRGVLPALRVMRRQRESNAGASTITLSELSAAIDALAPLDVQATARRAGAAADFSVNLLPDMLLLEGLMRAAQVQQIEVSEVPADNLPALLIDERAFAWARQHHCYLERLKASGLQAYFSDSASCPQR